MKIVILGSGIIGVTTAYYLTQRGHQVTVIERQSQTAAECSFANGGQLSYSHVEPWASPNLFPKVFKWLVTKHSPLVCRPQLDPVMWKWMAQFLRNCTEKKVRETTINMMRLSLYSKACIAEIEEETGITFSHLKKGTLHIFKNEQALLTNIKQAEFQKTLGCDFEILSSREACLEKEPALINSPKQIMGGLFFPVDESGDVHEFAVNLAKYAEEKGAVFKYDTKVIRLEREGDKVTKIVTDQGDFMADSYVLSLGAYSPLYVRPHGIKLPVYPMKGYSISIPVKNPQATPMHSLTDQANKIVYSRLGSILRVAGTAEFAGYNHDVYDERIETLRKMTKCLFPDSGDIDLAKPWACLRPQTPDGAPVLGKSPLKNLFFNTGQGTLGWTLSGGSGKVVADLVEGKKPEVDLTGLTMERFGS